MYFNVYADFGGEIHGYLIPDGFSAKPRIMTLAHGKTLGPFACDVFLEGPYKHKHHETGIVGFVLDEGKVPGINNAFDIEISDAETGFVFYRRLRPGLHIEQRIFRLETQFVPHRELDLSLKPHFQFYADGAERYGAETVRQMLEISRQPSVYVSGRVMLKSVQGYFTDDLIRIASLRDPFYELAIRLWIIAGFKRRQFSFLPERDAMLFEPAIGYFGDMNFSDPAEIKNKIKYAPKDILALFESPFTHQIVASSPTDKVSREAVSGALDALSQFTIFSANETDSSLATDIGELIGIKDNSIHFTPVRPLFLEIASILRGIQTLEQVLENDLILFYFIKKAEGRLQGEGD